MATKESIIPIRVTTADRARLRRAAGDEPLSSWLRRLALTEAHKREAAADVARALDALSASGQTLSDEAAGKLAAEAKAWARSRKR
jgi:hypothetical protein